MYKKHYCNWWYFEKNIPLNEFFFLIYRTLKCELASLINKENIYQTIIKEKSNAIRKLEKQLSDVVESQTLNTKYGSLIFIIII